jgi:O-antigen/teichoic acid export membrane protein
LLYERRADLIQLITLASALANLALNIALIPTWQMIGAAWAMLISFAVLTGGSHILAQRVMRVNYHWADIAKISAMGGVVLAVEALAGTLLAPRFMTLLRLGLLMAFPLALVFSGVFSWREVASVQALGVRYLRRFRHPALQH